MKPLIFKKVKSSKIETYSVSSLKALSGCSEYFKLKYIDKIRFNNYSESTITGSLAHDALEILHQGDKHNSLIDIFKTTALETLKGNKVLDKNLPEKDLQNIIDKCFSFAEKILQLHIRASEGYEGVDAIRKADKTVAASPTSTASWKKAEVELGINQLKSSIDYESRRLNPELKDISLSSAFGEAYYICYNYQLPDNLVKTLATEMVISEYDYDTSEVTNPVPMPLEYGGDRNIYLKAYIDWVGILTIDGKECLTILDYKTSKEVLTPEKVNFNVQLLTYAYAYELLSGVKVDAIGIHNLRSNTVSVVPIDREIMKAALKSLFGKHKIIENQLFSKHVPDSDYSPCLSSFGSKCEYCHICWPSLFTNLEHAEPVQSKKPKTSIKPNVSPTKPKTKEAANQISTNEISALMAEFDIKF